MTIRLVLADDHRLLPDETARSLEHEPGLEVAARCGDAEETLWAVDVFRPDVLLLGLHLPPHGAAAVLRRLAREGAAVQTVVLADDEAGDELLEAVGLGVRGVVPEGTAPGPLARCVRAVHGGGRWLDPGLEGRALDRFLAREAGRQRAATFC